VECAVLAYKSPAEVRRALEPDPKGHPLQHFEWLEASGRSFDSQGFVCVVQGQVILSFRGTKELRDFLTDVLLVQRPLKDFHGKVADGIGKVHAGFQRALNALWSEQRSARRHALDKTGTPLDDLLRTLANRHPEGKLWLTGHSLGAALATIAAARIQLTPDAPFNGRIGALVTIGSPRVLDQHTADRVRQELGSEHICRIHRSIDPVPAVPYWRFRHVSGRKAFVTNQGKLVMGVAKGRRWLERSGALLRALEDSVGSALPGQHRGFGRFATDHDSEDYLAAVVGYNSSDRVRARDAVGPIAAPLLKLAGVGTMGWTVAETTGLLGVAAKTAGNVAGFLQMQAGGVLALLAEFVG